MGALRQRTISIIMFVIMVFSCFTGMTFSVGAETSGEYEYEVLEDGTVSITKYNGSDTNVIIPSNIDEKKVTAIGYEAFFRLENITSVTIPDGVAEIGYSSFYGCTGLTSVEMPDSVKTISCLAFRGCIGLTNIEIPNSVTEIDDDAFSCCSGLTSVKIPYEIIKISQCAFADCTALVDVTIPEGVKQIDLGAFLGCTNLKKVIIPSSVTEIRYNAFGYYQEVNKVGDYEWKKIDDLTIYGYSGSDAERYAIENEFEFVSLDLCLHPDTEIVNAKEATCTEKGYTGDKVCTNCKTVLEKGVELPSLGHEDDDNDGICDICGEETKPDTDCDKTGHVDSDKDGKCDTCGDVMPEVKNCKCICHKGGIAKIFYKLFRFFWRIFGMKKVCDCGLAHY